VAAKGGDPKAATGRFREIQESYEVLDAKAAYHEEQQQAAKDRVAEEERDQVREKERAARAQATREKLEKAKVEQELAAREQASRERAVRERREQAAREKEAKEREAREKASREEREREEEDRAAGRRSWTKIVAQIVERREEEARTVRDISEHREGKFNPFAQKEKVPRGSTLEHFRKLEQEAEARVDAATARWADEVALAEEGHGNGSVRRRQSSCP